jgi:branched-chain amino acid transport system substrate-binding protein
MSQDIIDGFFAAIPEQYRSYFQFYPEYVDRGNNELVKTAVNKLCTFHNVDIVSGIISYKVIDQISSIIEQRRKLAFFFDLGEYLPPLNAISGSLFFNSLQLWQMEYALGRWAQQKFKGKGAILMSIYEAGYHMHASFCQGVFSEGMDEIDMHILPFDPNVKNSEEGLGIFLERIKESNVEYLHAMFCGKEAADFYNAYLKSGLQNKIPLIVSSHMASEEIINGLNTELSLYSASGWNYDSVDEKNISFKKTYEFITGKRATEFAVMGFEMGELFAQIIPELQRNEMPVIINAIKNTTISGPRGKRNFHHDLSLASPTIDIEKIILKEGKATKIIVDQGEALKYNHQAFADIHVQSVSGWKNPYLCI